MGKDLTRIVIQFYISCFDVYKTISKMISAKLFEDLKAHLQDAEEVWIAVALMKDDALLPSWRVSSPAIPEFILS